MDKKSLWNEAGLPGLVLGLVPIACMAVNQICNGSGVLSVLVWILKFGGCIYLMYFFLKRFLLGHDEAGRSDVFRFGLVVALLSALVCAGCQLAYVLLINPDMYEEAVESALNSGLSSQLDSNSLAAFEEMIPRLPVLSFFANLVYCFLFGLVVSAIVSSSLVSNNPFDDNKEQQ